MGKLLLGIVAILIVVIVGFNLIGATIFSKVLTDAVGAPVKVGDVRLDLMGSRVSIQDLKIENPEGFTEKNLAVIPEISVAYDLPSLFKGVARLPEVILNFNQVVVEKNQQGQINLMQLAPVSQATQGKPAPGQDQPETPKEEQKEAGKAMTVQIDKVDLSVGGAKYVDSANPSNSKELKINIEHQILKDVTNPRQITQQIVAIILKKVGMAELTSRLDVFTKGFETDVKSDMMKSGLGGFADKLKAQVGGESAPAQ
jgi:hypothetical protein